MAPEIEAALVLAAGRGRRMGVSKALLPHEGSFLLHRIARAYLDFGVRAVHAVVNDEVARTLCEHPPLSGLFLHEGGDAEAPMMDSVLRALSIASAEAFRAFFLQPVDSGPPSLGVLRQLQVALADGLVVKPTYHGQGGHPLAFTQEAGRRIRDLKGESLRARLRELEAHAVVRVEVDDQKVLRNWNAPEDLAE